jgi:hypothetical protein
MTVVAVTGLSALGSVSSVVVWGPIVPSPGSTWTEVNPNAINSWTQVVPAPSTTWTNIAL